MNIALLSAASSIHTIRWANGLNAAGCKVHIISQHPLLEPLDDGIHVHLFPFRGAAGYFTMVPVVRRLLRQIKPDIVNAHFASGYGTTARLVAYHPWLLSVWGSDVYEFPYKSWLHHQIIRGNILAADAIASTSHCMARQTTKISTSYPGKISITPFGVDMAAYCSISPLSPNKPTLTIGTVKEIDEQYGIDTLIEAYALLQDRLFNENHPLRGGMSLRLVGDGPQIQTMKEITARLDIEDSVSFVGRVAHSKVPNELEKLDIYVALSRFDSESFGVAIIEAGAAGRPVVVSDAGGLPEVVQHGITGLVVPRENPQTAMEALYELVMNPDKRKMMGEAGRRHVNEHYAWKNCVDTMISVYEKTIALYKSKK